ncbi:Chemotaxis protein methyltransferase Cher2 [Pelotomaculum sp. FP]|uniref:CheR family methyltransferase n=1 Tax=Pelotomaculum sp. FP TaxID=261474 RepID=UPI0011011DC6|nr:protein-glutamate O-methyltransferase CheR [Pelotomaculum sp. FP]TEB14896.1 Chemotaxis protein methyltransferase Cher2 [Pelotomaculum sp. FP]
MTKDVTNIPDNLPFSQLNDYLSINLGLHFPKERRHDLKRGLAAAGIELGFDNTLTFTRWLITTPATRKKVEVLASHLTVGETYFFRDENCFRTLEEHILETLRQSPPPEGKRLKIWSAGCSTGEEPYSIAILLSKFSHFMKDWNVTILATDINPLSLRKAVHGLYGEWSFRGTPEWVKQKYFIKKESGLFEIQPSVKQMVDFSYLNLVEDSYPSYINNTCEVDVILCRNVLMYFGAARRNLVVQRLHSCLAEGGWLAVSPSEMSPDLFSQFSTVNPSGTVVYKKDRHQSTSPVCRATGGISLDPAAFIKHGLTNTNKGQEAGLTAQSSANHKSPQLEEQVFEDADRLFKTAFAMFERCRYTDAAEKLAVALSSISAGETSYVEKSLALMARANANLGKLHDAKDWCERAIAFNKLDPSLHYLLATILQEQNQLEEAISALNRTLYLDRDYLLAHYALGNIKRQIGKLEESDKHFDHALIILGSYAPGDLLPNSDGMTAGRLSEMIISMKSGSLHALA